MAEINARLSAALSDRYRIERELGAGGMATVYLAEDLRHHRKVAIKVLKPELAAVVGAERFLAEIQTTANLQHPHILPLFDSGQADSFLFYVMPFVEGESLRERLDRERQLPVDEGVRIATDLAEALDYAHRKGVIHRDIKPANVLLLDGRPVIADFGIALAVGAAGGGRLTETGLSLGTPHYMSPEQATGAQHIGPVTDIYALGCVFYEMLVGEPPYTGATAQAVLGKIIAGAPEPVSSHRKTVPPNVDAAIRRALEKVPADRFGTAGEFARALAESSFRHGPLGFQRDARQAEKTVQSRIAAFAVVIWAVVATTFALWGALKATPTPSLNVTRTTVTLPVPTNGGNGSRLDVSRDGRSIVFAGGEGEARRLFIRRTDQVDIRELAGTDGATQPAFSPDGQWIVYVSNDGLAKIPSDGGPALVLARDGTFASPNWGADGFIYCVCSGNIARVPEAGGEPEVLLIPGTDGESYRYPVLVPEGRGILFTRFRSLENSDVAFLDLETRDVIPVLPSGVHARYLPTGHLVFGASNGSLMSVPFDPVRREVTGPSSQVLPKIAVFPGGATQLAFSETGTAAYLTEALSQTVRLTVLDAQGQRETLPVTAQRTRGVARFSPDGRFIVFESNDEIRLYDVALRTDVPLTIEGQNALPFWFPDGRTIGFSSVRAGSSGWDGYKIAMDGSRPEEAIFSRAGNQWPEGWTPDGRLLTSSLTLRGDYDLEIISPNDSTSSTPYLDGEWNDPTGRISPDGRFVAHNTDESGRYEVFVRGFPEPSTRVQISVNGGSEPVWSKDGRRVYYRDGNALLAATVTTAPSFQVIRRDTIFADLSDYFASNRLNPAAYDIHPDGNRFLFLALEQEGRGADAELTIVSNWFEEVRSLLGNGASPTGP
jgi:serine/threonine protein kinase/Tol biopolymer transport system component